jgi:chromosome segregation ATPase
VPKSASVTAAHVTWRPLGALLVEKGLLTAEELEDALAAQQTTGKRLGQILVDRGHVSGPALTNALAEQYGIELTTEEGFGTGLRAEIERRHSTRRPPAAAEEPVADSPPEMSAETETNGDNGHGDAALAELEPQLEEHWARLAAAEADLAARDARIVELEAELGAMKRRLHESSASSSAAEQVHRLQEVITEQDKALRTLEHALQAREAADDTSDEARVREAALAARATELAERERELAEHEQVLAGRQRGILTAAADLEQRTRSLEERERFLARRDAAAPEIVPAPAEAGEPAAHRLPPRRDPHGWSLDALTRLVEERADDFPDRVDEWRYTLFYLRTEAGIDGMLPSKFDALVDECFGELLGTHPAAAALAR